MTILIKKLHRRLRNKSDLRHNPSVHGKGRWHSVDTLWRSKMKAKRKRKIAARSRAANR